MRAARVAFRFLGPGGLKGMASRVAFGNTQVYFRTGELKLKYCKLLQPNTQRITDILQYQPACPFLHPMRSSDHVANAPSRDSLRWSSMPIGNKVT